MRNLQVKNIPTELHRKLTALARARGRTLREIVLGAVEREVAQAEFRSRFAKRSSVRLGRPAATSLDEEREARERERSSR